MKQVILSVLCIAWAAPFGAARAALQLKPDDLPRLVRENNKTARGAALSAAAAEAKTGYLLRSFLPSVRLEGGQEKFKTGAFPKKTEPFGAAEARVNVFRWGKDYLEERARKAEYEAAEARQQFTEAEQIAAARKLYWKLVSQHEIAGILREAIGANDVRLKAAARRVARGVTTSTDRLEFQMSGGQLREDLESIEHEAFITAIRLKAILGLPGTESISTLDAVAHDHDDELLKAQDATKTPAVAFLAANETAAASRASVADRAWTPALEVYGSYHLFTFRDRERPARQDRDEYALGVRISMNLWDGGESFAQASTQRLATDAHKAELGQQRIAVDAEIRAAQEEMKHAHDLIHGVEDRVEQAAKYVAHTMSEYDRGVKNSPDALNALEKRLGFRRRLVEIKLDYQVAKATLLQHLGQ